MDRKSEVVPFPELPDGLNQLERLLCLARGLDRGWTLAMAGDARAREFGALLVDAEEEVPLAHRHGRPCATSVEDGGVLGAILWLNARDGWQGVFVNDLARMRFGIDVAGRHVDGSWLLCEAKGTERGFEHAGHYLRRTRRRGRQLSWCWCLRALEDFATEVQTARLFLDAHRDVIEGRARRALVVTRVECDASGFTLGRTKAFDEDALREVRDLDDVGELARWRRWLAEHDAAPERLETDAVRRFVAAVAAMTCRVAQDPPDAAASA